VLDVLHARAQQRLQLGPALEVLGADRTARRLRSSTSSSRLSFATISRYLASVSAVAQLLSARGASGGGGELGASWGRAGGEVEREGGGGSGWRIYLGQAGEAQAGEAQAARAPSSALTDVLASSQRSRGPPCAPSCCRPQNHLRRSEQDAGPHARAQRSRRRMACAGMRGCARVLTGWRAVVQEVGGERGQIN